MGCVSSKKLKKQAKLEACTMPVYPLHMQNQGDLQHCVSLTSSTYGLLKIESPQHKVMPSHRTEKSWPQGHCDFFAGRDDPSVGECDITEEAETLNVRDIMAGLEDTGSSYQSPVKVVNAVVSKRLVPKKPTALKTSVSFHTVEELDAHVRTATSAAKGFKLFPAKELHRSSSLTLHSQTECFEQNLAGKENTQPSGPEREGLGGLRMGNGKHTSVLQPNNSAQVLKVSMKERYHNKEDSTGKTARSCQTDMSISTKPVNANKSLNLEKVAMLKSKVDDAALKSKSPNTYTEPSSPLFDPDLLATYERALKSFSEDDWDAIRVIDQMGKAGTFPSEEPIFVSTEKNCKTDLEDLNSRHILELQNEKRSLIETFEKRCPPGGENRLVLYTTTLRGIRKTFEDCNKLRDVLQDASMTIDERDVSMHLEFRSELRELVGHVSVPRLFVKGRYIGGVEEVSQLHEDGKLEELFEGLPVQVAGNVCNRCGGVRFVLCLECCGSCKIVKDKVKVVRCPDCNENGLVQCPICS